MDNDRMRHLLDRAEAVDVIELANLPPEEFEEQLRDAADAQRELLMRATQQIMNQMRGGS